MKRYIDIICPVSLVKADENVARTAAVFTVIVTAAALLTGSYIILFLLAADFALRAFSSGSASIIKILAMQAAGVFNLRNKKMIDAAPKKFAALLGMTFSFLAAIFLLFQLPVTALIIGSILIFCALLEGLFGYCLGCVVYTIITSSSGRSS